MTRLWTLAATAAIALLLSGCSSGGGDDDLMVMPQTATADPAPIVQAPPVPQPVTKTCTQTRTNLGTTTGYGLNVDRVLVGVDECRLEELFDGNISWAGVALVEATWTAQTTQTGTDLWLESQACQPTIPPRECPAHVRGPTSPLTLELGTDLLRSIEGQTPLLWAAGEGVVQDLQYTLYVTLFPDATVPPGFTAVP